MPPLLNNLAGLNAVVVAKGGIVAYLNEINALNGIDVIEAGTGGFLNDLAALNSIDVLLGGTGIFLNDLDALNSIVVLEGGVGGHLNTIDALNEWVDNAEGGLTYLLRATWDEADDQSYADTQVLNTPALGVENGSFTVAEGAGTLSVVSNKIQIIGSENDYSANNIRSATITRLLGTLLYAKGQYTAPAAATFCHICDFHTVTPGDTDPGTYNNEALSLRVDVSNNLTVFTSDSTNRVVGVTTVTTDYEFGIVLGGFNAAGEPFYTGQTKADYKFGELYFIKGGVFTNWTLLWVSMTGNTTPVYPMVGMVRVITILIDREVVPDRDYSLVQIPIHFSSFDAANGTSLDAVTPEVGTAFVEQNGAWDIQGNKANTTGADPGGPGWVATSEISDADVFVEMIAKPTSASSAGIILRYLDNDNLWAVLLEPDINRFAIYDRVAGTWTLRASASVTLTPGVEYRVTAIADGSTITGFVDGANKISYASAIFNQTETLHGMRDFTVSEVMDNFVVRVLTSFNYNNELDIN